MSFFIGLLMAAAAEPTITVTAPAIDKVVCKRGEQSETGSRMAPSRICKRQSEWDLEARQTERTLRSFDDQFKAPAVAGGRPDNPGGAQIVPGRP